MCALKKGCTPVFNTVIKLTEICHRAPSHQL